MGLSGTIDPTIYEGLKDVLQRYPTVTTVTYEPNSIVKQSLQAQVDPNRVAPPSGPEAPTLDIEWRFTDQDAQYRIHYADPNLGFDCGWHRDDDHPELGAVHFQYKLPGEEDPKHERATISKDVPTEILWLVLERLFEEKLPDLLNSS